MRTLDKLLAATMATPTDEHLWLIVADWLEEHDDPRRAELLRLHRQLLATCCVPEQHPERTEQQARLVELLAQGVRPCVPQRTVALGDGVEMTFSFIPPGTFLMGSPPDEEGRDEGETQHGVTLTKGFFLGVQLVTEEQWQHVMGSNPSHSRGTANWPVEAVSWDDCQEFCRKVGEIDGQPYRLPTEAEWEYACRAGTTTPFWFGETLSTDQANYDCNYIYGTEGNSPFRKKTAPVGSYPANAWSLTDMHANLWEWCQDWYGNYPSAHSTNPEGPRSGEARVLRGGSWDYSPQRCRAAYRGGNGPVCHYHLCGCRLAFSLD